MLFFLHVGSRRVIVSEPTLHPTREWTAGQASMFIERAQVGGQLSRPPDERTEFWPAAELLRNRRHRLLPMSGIRINHGNELCRDRNDIFTGH